MSKEFYPQSNNAQSSQSEVERIDFRLINLDRCLAIGSISESTFLRLVKRRLLPGPIKIGRANRWVEADVIAAFQRLAQGGV